MGNSQKTTDPQMTKHTNDLRAWLARQECIAIDNVQCRDNLKPQSSWCVICSAQAVAEQQQRELHIQNWINRNESWALRRKANRAILIAALLAAVAVAAYL